MVVTRRKKEVIYHAAPVWKRLLAFIIDMLVLEFFVFSHFDSIIAQFTEKTLGMQLTYFSVVIGAIGGLVFIYFTAMEYAYGQTLGHMAISLKLMSDDFSFWRIALSNVSFLPFFPFIVLWVLDPLVLFFSQTHQRFMHLLLGMYVIEEVPVEWGGLHG